jgi:hypothetical protein
MNRRKTAFLAAAGLFALALAAPQPQADIRILAHDRGDLAPSRIKAAFDLGIVGISVLVTWSAERLAD